MSRRQNQGGAPDARLTAARAPTPAGRPRLEAVLAAGMQQSPIAAPMPLLTADIGMDMDGTHCMDASKEETIAEEEEEENKDGEQQQQRPLPLPRSLTPGSSTYAPSRGVPKAALSELSLACPSEADKMQKSKKRYSALLGSTGNVNSYGSIMDIKYIEPTPTVDVVDPKLALKEPKRYNVAKNYRDLGMSFRVLRPKHYIKIAGKNQMPKDIAAEFNAFVLDIARYLVTEFPDAGFSFDGDNYEPETAPFSLLVATLLKMGKHCVAIRDGDFKKDTYPDGAPLGLAFVEGWRALASGDSNVLDFIRLSDNTKLATQAERWRALASGDSNVLDVIRLSDNTKVATQAEHCSHMLNIGSVHEAFAKKKDGKNTAGFQEILNLQARGMDYMPVPLMPVNQYSAAVVIVPFMK